MANIVLGLGTSGGSELQGLLENIAEMELVEAPIFVISDQAKSFAYIHVDREGDAGERTGGPEPSPASESTEPSGADQSIDWVRALKHWGSPIVTCGAPLEGSSRSPRE